MIVNCDSLISKLLHEKTAEFLGSIYITIRHFGTR